MDNVIPFNPKEEDPQLIWRCNCGSLTFYVSTTYIECSECETIQNFPKENY